jgi:flagellar hook-associated protein 3 FlgL
MRITDSMVYSQSLLRLQNQFAALNVASAQVTTGTRNAELSDDPSAGNQVLQIDTTNRQVTQYQRNITSATAQSNAEESTLDQLTDLLSRAQELATTGATDTDTASGRAASGAEVDAILQQAISLGNLQVGDQYIFGGSATAAPPFETDGTYIGDNNARQTVINQGETITATHTGQQIFVDSGVLSSLSTLRDALNSNDVTGVRNALTTLSTAFDSTQTTLAQVGARSDALTAAGSALTTQTTELANTRSTLADIPTDEAALNLANVQNALQAGILATTKVLNLSLANYLTTGTVSS